MPDSIYLSEGQDVRDPNRGAEHQCNDQVGVVGQHGSKGIQGLQRL